MFCDPGLSDGGHGVEGCLRRIDGSADQCDLSPRLAHAQALEQAPCIDDLKS